MANALYDLGREEFLLGDIDFVADTIIVTLVDAADYTKNLATDDFYDDVPGAARVATSTALASKTSAAGTADAADKTLTAVSGDVSEQLVVWRDTTNEATSQLIANYDTATGLPVTPNGGDIVIAWNASGLFRL